MGKILDLSSRALKNSVQVCKKWHVEKGIKRNLMRVHQYFWMVLDFVLLVGTIPAPRCNDCSGWRWKRHSLHASKQQWPKLIWDRLMHHRAVSVALHVVMKSLHRITPCHFAHFRAAHRQAREMLAELISNLRQYKVQERIPETRVLFLQVIDWKVHKVVAAFKTFCI